MKLYNLSYCSDVVCFTNGAKYIWHDTDEDGNYLGNKLERFSFEQIGLNAYRYYSVEDFVLSMDWIKK